MPVKNKYMWLSVKSLRNAEKEICFKTISPTAIYAIIGDAVINRRSMSIVRMGDGEFRILETADRKQFDFFEHKEDGWNERQGLKGISIDILRKNLMDAGNNCTYFAPSVSGISTPLYHLYDVFKPRPYYFDNFFVEIWTAVMIKMLLEASGGAFIIHRNYEKIIDNFGKNYEFDSEKKVAFRGFAKNNWDDNEQAIEAAVYSGMQLILFSAGSGGKIIGPEIAKAENKIVLDVGNALIHWSEKTMPWSGKNHRHY